MKKTKKVSQNKGKKSNNEFAIGILNGIQWGIAIAFILMGFAAMSYTDTFRGFMMGVVTYMTGLFCCTWNLLGQYGDKIAEGKK